MILETEISLQLIRNLSTLCIIWGIYKTKVIGNPVSLFSLGIFVLILSSQINRYFIFVNQSSETNIATPLVFALLGFVSPWIFYSKDKLPKLYIEQSKPFTTFFVFSIVFILVLSLIFVLIGYVPMIEFIKGTINVNKFNSDLENLPLGLMALRSSLLFVVGLYLASLIYSKWLFKQDKYLLFIISLIILIGFFWNGKRQIILIFIFFVGVRFFQEPFKKISIIKIFKTGLLSFIVLASFVFIFSLIGALRFNSSKVKSYDALLEYSIYPSLNFNAVVNKVQADGIPNSPNYVFSQIIPYKFRGKRIESLRTFVPIPVSPSTYFAPWYLDFGSKGCFLGSLILSFVSKLYFKKRLHNEHYMRINLLILWSCATVGIYSHFISINFLILPLISLYLIMKFIPANRIRLITN